jgi:hypothetical protein
MLTQRLTKTPARYLQPGDVTGSGETVCDVSAGVRTPRGKVEVILEKDGRSRLAVWGASTVIGVRRPA